MYRNRPLHNEYDITSRPEKWQFFKWVCLKAKSEFAKGYIDNEPTLIHVIAWHRHGEQELPEPVVACDVPVKNPEPYKSID